MLNETIPRGLPQEASESDGELIHNLNEIGLSSSLPRELS